MILDSMRLKWISDEKGYGLFAAQKIPKGTVTFVDDLLNIVIAPGKENGFLLENPTYRKIIDKYSYQEKTGERILCWDLGKYVNHCCHANCLSTGYSFEVAIRDIQEGEEITDDYRLFNTEHLIPNMNCKQGPCEMNLSFERSPLQIEKWDGLIRSALEEFFKVEQPLAEFLSKSTLSELKEFMKDPTCYRSISEKIP